MPRNGALDVELSRLDAEPSDLTHLPTHSPTARSGLGLALLTPSRWSWDERSRTTACVNVSAVIERVDEQVSGGQLASGAVDRQPTTSYSSNGK